MSSSEDVGIEFDLPVDDEHKATVLKLLSFKPPHMRSFHLSWISFFVCFCSTFAAAPLLPIIRDDLDLDRAQITQSGIAAVSGTILARVLMGTFCDVFGPRFGIAALMLGTAPAVFCMSIIDSAGGFLAARLCVGFSLAAFVANQYWSSVMFSGKIVGVANATTGGWGNLGGGATQILMPLLVSAMRSFGSDFYAWRLAYFVPGAMHIVVGVLVLGFAQDLPDGQYSQLKEAGHLWAQGAAEASAGLWAGVSNYRTWCLVGAYAACFGVELTMNNIVVSYLYDQFRVDLKTAGLLGSLFGLMNLVARSAGGVASDLAARWVGMRGRLWVLWVSLLGSGLLCVIMGSLSSSLAGTVSSMVLFSACVQASEGATFGVVPFVSRRALGVVAGLVGAGGNAGSAVLQALFFGQGSDTPEGIRHMGFTILCLSLGVVAVHFPMWGGMFCAEAHGASEEEYYSRDFSDAEVKAGHHQSVLKFANLAKSQRQRAGRGGAGEGDAEAGDPS